MINDSVKIDNVRYSIENVDRLVANDDDATKLNGSISHNNAAIKIDSSLDPQVKMLVVLHEVVHAILVNANKKFEEDQVDAIARGMYYFIGHNPEWVAEIVELQRGV